MANKVTKAYNVEKLRFTKVDNCGRPIYGPCSTLIVECFETIQINADLDDGEEIAPVNANGKYCFYVPPPKLDKGFEVVATFNAKNPALYTALNPNWLQIIDEVGNLVGYEHISETSLTAGVAIEGWETVSGGQCDPGGVGSWNYFNLPYVTNFVPGDAERGNAVHQDEWTGHTLGGNNWGVGPYNVRKNASTGTAGPLLVAQARNSHFLDFVTTLAPPASTDECIPLSNPAGPPITASSCVTGGLLISITATSARPMQADWGDGTAPETLTTAVAKTHTYTTAGRYVVTVRFTDAAQEETYRVFTVPCP
jgi:hypothetical protein